MTSVVGVSVGCVAGMEMGVSRSLDGAGAVAGNGGREYRGVKCVPKPVLIDVGKNFPLESRSGSFFLGARFVDRRKKKKIRFKPQKRKQIDSKTR
jgi:hypothetical protein